MKLITLIILLLLCLSGANSLQASILGYVLANGWIEEAAVFPVPNSDYILTQFQFSVQATPNSQAASTISPALWDLIHTHNFETLELTLTRGRWPSSSVSPPPLWAATPPPGLELKLAFPTNTTSSTTESINSNVDLQRLGYSLSSLVAASVPTLMDQGVWVAPVIGWWSSSSRTQGSTQAVHRRQLYGALTQEGPCVENVSAWLKLLPCRAGDNSGQGGAGAGLVNFLQTEEFVAAPLHSLQLSIDTTSSLESDTTSNSRNRGIRVNLGFTLLQKGKNKNLVVDAFTAALVKTDFSSCPAAIRSSILLPNLGSDVLEDKKCTPINAATQWLCTLTPAHDNNIICPPPPPPETSSNDDNLWNLDVSSSMILLSPHVTKLSLAATLTGPAMSMTSTSASTSRNSVLVHIMQMVPWEVALRWHTLKISFNGTPIPLNNSKNLALQPAEVGSVVWQNLKPAEPRGNAALIEVLLKLPVVASNTTRTDASDNYLGQVHLEVEIKKKLLTIFDFPPDASRGIDVPAALVTFVPPEITTAAVVEVERSSSSLLAVVLGCATSRSHASLRLQQHSYSHLINLPIPDASMPFNVVCFTSTVIALAFSSALNAILTKTPLRRREQGEDGDESEKEKRKRAIKLRLLRVVFVLITVGMTAVYMDKDLQRQVDGWLVELRSLWPSAPGSHHPEL